MKTHFFTVLLALIIGLSAKGQTEVFSEGFEDAVGSVVPASWTATKTSGNDWRMYQTLSGGSPHEGVTSAGVQAPSYGAANDSWLFSSGFEMQSGKTYEITFWRANFGNGNTYTSQFRMTVGTSASAADTLQSVYVDESRTISATLAWEKVTSHYTATETKTYHLGFQDYSTTGAGSGMPPQWKNYIDEITVVEAQEDPEPQRFSENFDAVETTNFTTTLPAGWTAKKIAGTDWYVRSSSYITAGTPHSPANSVGIGVNPMTTNDSWIFSSGIEMESGKTYRIRFYRAIFGNGTAYTAKLKATIGTSASETDTIQSIFVDERTTVKLDWEQITQYYAPATTDTYYIGFQDYSTGGTGQPPLWRNYIDDVELVEYEQPTTCDAPTNLALFAQNYTAATFTWDGSAEEYAFTLTEKGSSNVVFSKIVNIDSIVVPRSYLQGEQEYTFSVAGICGTLNSAAVSEDFTAIKDSFDFSITLPAQPYDNSTQTNMSATTSWQITIKNGSTTAATNVAYQIMIYDTISKTQTIVNDTIKTEISANTGTAQKSHTLDFSAAPAYYQVSAMITDERDMHSANDTVTKRFTHHRADYGVTEIISPASGNLLTNAETVKVAVKNFGTDTLRYFNFIVRLNGEIVGSDDYYSQYCTCAIAPNDTAHFTYKDYTLDLSEFGDYEIVAYTEYQYNHNALNDSTRVIVTNSAPDGHKDAFVTTILDPAFPIRLSAAENIRITVKNNSKDAVSNLSVKLMVNGEVKVNDVIEESIAGLGEEYIHTFTNVDLSEYEEYTIKAWTELQGDVNQANDTMTKIFTNLESSPDVPFKETFEEIADYEYPNGWWMNQEYNWYVSELQKLRIDDTTFTFGMKPRYIMLGNTYSARDFLMVTKGVTLVKGQSYKIRFNLYTDQHFAPDGDDFEKLIVSMGNAQAAENMSDTLFMSEDKVYENEEVSTIFTADSTGFYYLGFHAIAETAIGYILIDSLTINVEILNSLEILADKFPYTQMPVAMTKLPAISAKAQNIGTNKQDNVNLSVTFNDAAYGNSNTISELEADAVSGALTIAAKEVDIQNGTNTLVYTVNADATSDEFSNPKNSVAFTFEGTEHVLAMDTVENEFVGVGSVAPTEIVGNVFDISETVKLNQVEIGFASGANMPYTIELYKITGTQGTEGRLTYNTTALFVQEATREAAGFTTIRVPETELAAGQYFLGIKTNGVTHDIACDKDAAKINFSTPASDNGVLSPNKFTAKPNGALAIRMILNDPEPARWDVGITAITEPVTGELTDEEIVVITVKNFGNVEVSDISVKLMLGDAVVATETVEGPIAPDAVLSYTFDHTLDLSEIKTYTITAFTALEDDVDATNDTAEVTVTNTTSSIADREEALDIKVYPNPVSDKLFIQTAENIKHVEIYNVQGKLIKRIENKVSEIHINDLKSGIYILKITTGNGVVTQQFIKH